jgi:hypothetical protein
MSERFVLHWPADLVEHPVGHSGQVERVSYPARMGDMGWEPAPASLGRVHLHDPHPSAPAPSSACRTSSQLGSTFTFGDVDTWRSGPDRPDPRHRRLALSVTGTLRPLFFWCFRMSDIGWLLLLNLSSDYRVNNVIVGRIVRS